MSSPTRVTLAADHAGYPLKEEIKKYLQKKGVEVVDVGADSEDPVDYPAIIREGCREVLDGGGMGIFFGGSGNGEAMAANKVPGIRAAVCWDTESARLARAHNDANVMSLGSRLLNHAMAPNIVDTFLATSFEGGRHLKRISDLETPLS